MHINGEPYSKSVLHYLVDLSLFVHETLPPWYTLSGKMTTWQTHTSTHIHSWGHVGEAVLELEITHFSHIALKLTPKRRYAHRKQLVNDKRLKQRCHHWLTVNWAIIMTWIITTANYNDTTALLLQIKLIRMNIRVIQFFFKKGK